MTIAHKAVKYETFSHFADTKLVDKDVYLTHSANQQCLYMRVRRLVRRSTNRNRPIMSSQNKMAAHVDDSSTAIIAEFSSEFCVMHVVPSA